MQGIDKTLWIPFLAFTIISTFFVFAGLASNSYLRGRHLRGLLDKGKIKMG